MVMEERHGSKAKVATGRRRINLCPEPSIQHGGGSKRIKKHSHILDFLMEMEGQCRGRTSFNPR